MNNRDAGDLRRHRTHYEATVILWDLHYDIAPSCTTSRRYHLTNDVFKSEARYCLDSAVGNQKETCDVSSRSDDFRNMT